MNIAGRVDPDDEITKSCLAHCSNMLSTVVIVLLRRGIDMMFRGFMGVNVATGWHFRSLERAMM